MKIKMKTKMKTKAKKVTKPKTKKKPVAKPKTKLKVKPKTKKRGFTLIEMLIVVAIIGVLATVVLVAVVQARKKSNATAAKTIMSQYKQAIEMYKANGCNGSSVIFTPPAGAPWTDCNTEVLMPRFVSPVNPGTFPLGMSYFANAGATYDNYTLTLAGFAGGGSFICSNGACTCTDQTMTGCTKSP